MQDPQTSSRRLATAELNWPVHVDLLERSHLARNEAELFIHDVFSRHFQADIHHFMPELLTLRDHHGGLMAALGIRSAAKEPLFLETYLDESVDDCMNRLMPVFDGEIKRDQIMEVGNLAARGAGGSRWLIVALTAYLQGAGYDWVTFTALPSLRNAFRRIGLKVIPLKTASIDRLSRAEQLLWGRYYEHKPEVVAVNVHHAYGMLDKLLRLERSLQLLITLWQKAYNIGSERCMMFSTYKAILAHE